MSILKSVLKPYRPIGLLRFQRFFEFNSDGELVDGYRNSSDEPIDYSALLSDGVLAADFAKSSLGCPDCVSPPFYWEDQALTYTVISERLMSGPRIIWALASSTYDVFDQSVILAEPSEKKSTADFTIVIGNEEFLRSEAWRLNDDQSWQYYSRLLRHENADEVRPTMLSELFKGTKCQFSRVESDKTRAYAYLTLDDLDVCITKQFLMAVGLKPFAGPTPSTLNVNYNYRLVTVADTIFVLLHYFLGPKEIKGPAEYMSDAENLVDVFEFERRMR